MRPKLTLLLSLVLAGPALAVDGVIEINQVCAVQTGCFPGDAAGFPVTLSNTSGSYRLTSDLSVSTNSAVAIEITNSRVTLDLNGFSIVGPGSCVNIPPNCSGSLGTQGIRTRSDQPVRIRNGTLTGLLTAINVLPSTSSVVLEDLNIEANGGTAIFFTGSGASTVRDCRINRNGISGMDIDTSHPVLVTGSTFRSNGNIAIDSDGAATLVESSSFVGNGIGIRSFFLGSASSALSYRGNTLYANSIDVVGGTQLGPNLCTFGLCP